MEHKTNFVMVQETETETDEPPDAIPHTARPWRVAVIANVRGKVAVTENGPEDAGAEFDKIETIQAIQRTIESDGHTTVFLTADTTLPEKLIEKNPDICFNISEGLGGDGREAQVPALLEMLHIPYTCSRVLANAVGLDKTMTKRIWRDIGLPTARFQEFASGDEDLDLSLRFPMFVKPAREGTGMGMDAKSIVHSPEELRRKVQWVVNTYHQPALVEEYLSGREFTVAVLGRQDAALYSTHPELYGDDGFHRFPVLEVDHAKSATPGVYGHHLKTLGFDDEGAARFLCPADVSRELLHELQDLAIKAHVALGAMDVSRVDIRLDRDGKPCLIEINTLPGLTPDFSDLCVIANADGLGYRTLILEILNLAASRFGMLPKRSEPQVYGPVEVPVAVRVR
jgi:D-alanine-D-alanine ligase